MTQPQSCLSFHTGIKISDTGKICPGAQFQSSHAHLASLLQACSGITMGALSRRQCSVHHHQVRGHGSVGELSDGLNGLLPGRRGPPKPQHGGRQGALHQGQCRAGAPGTPNPEPRGGKERAAGRARDTRRRREGGAAGGAGPTGWRRAPGERARAARREERGERGPQPPPPRASRASRAQQFPQSCRRRGAQPAGDAALARHA